MALELRDETGGVAGAETFERTASVKPKTASLYRFSPRLVLDRVPAGRYTIDIAARSSLDDIDEILSRQIPITIRDRDGEPRRHALCSASPGQAVNWAAVRRGGVCEEAP
jgi:hypothetical protein